MFTCLEKIACVIGLHRYGEWTYVLSISCEQLPVCEQCGHFRPVRSRTVHVWGNPTYAAEDVCEKIQLCLRCRGTKPVVPAIVHLLGEYAFTSSDSCVMVRTCNRCRWIDFDSALTHHSFCEWVEATEDTCHQLRNCLRCGCQEVQEHHEWMPKPYGKSCTRCRTTRPIESGRCYQCGSRAISGDNVCYSCS